MLRGLIRSIPDRWKFAWRYLRGDIPWDTGITPPEVMEFLERASPGNALDLGCGTGTNAITLASRGWKVTGVDFAPPAIRHARRKAAEAGAAIDFRVADVSDLSMLAGRYDYALDLGCLHSLPERLRAGYAAGLERLVRPGGTYMLYAWLPKMRCGRRAGMDPEEAEGMLRAAFTMERMELGDEQAPAWYWFRRR